MTISFIALKRGLFSADGPDCVGDLSFAALDVPAAVYASSLFSARRVDWAKLGECLPARRRNVHKGHFGHVLVVGGNQGLGGAARLTAEAALRCGAGLVSLATRPEHVAASLAARPEIMAHGVEQAADWLPLPPIGGLKGFSITLQPHAPVPAQALFVDYLTKSGALGWPG